MYLGRTAYCPWCHLICRRVADHSASDKAYPFNARLRRPYLLVTSRTISLALSAAIFSSASPKMLGNTSSIACAFCYSRRKTISPIGATRFCSRLRWLSVCNSGGLFAQTLAVGLTPSPTRCGCHSAVLGSVLVFNNITIIKWVCQMFFAPAGSGGWAAVQGMHHLSTT